MFDYFVLLVYVGIAEVEEDDEAFEEKMKQLTAELSEQMKEG